MIHQVTNQHVYLEAILTSMDLMFKQEGSNKHAENLTNINALMRFISD